MNSFRLIIPTRDSARWSGAFLRAYRKLGVEPLYIVDARSVDQTAQILSDMNAEFMRFTPSQDFAESGMVEYGAKNAGSEWVLRLDDDEFPSKGLLSWIQESAVKSKHTAWAISRREASLLQGEFVYSQWPTRMVWTHAGVDAGRAGFCRNPQLRLFRPSEVTYVEKVHTSGVKTPDVHGYAPNNLFFVHCQNIILSQADRLAKIRRYARYDESAAWWNADEYLPESTDQQFHMFTSEGLQEFHDLFADISVGEMGASPLLTETEMANLTSGVQRYALSTLLEAQNIIERQHKESVLYFKYSYIRLLPWIIPALCIIYRVSAELFLTGGRIFKSRRIGELGLRLWHSRELLLEIEPVDEYL